MKGGKLLLVIPLHPPLEKGELKRGLLEKVDMKIETSYYFPSFLKRGKGRLLNKKMAVHMSQK